MLKGHGWLVLRTKQVCFCAEEQKNEGLRTKKGVFCAEEQKNEGFRTKSGVFCADPKGRF